MSKQNRWAPRALTKTGGLVVIATFIALALVSRASAITERLSLRFNDVQLSTGIRMHYGEQGNPAGMPVILLHGYSDSWYSYSRVLPLLPEGWHVYALDLRGQGDTDKPATGYTMREMALDVIAFMDAKKIERAVVVGHSTGGLIAQQVALAGPDRVDRLVLISTGRTGRALNGIMDLKQAVYGLTEPVSVDFVREFQYSTVHTPLPEAFMDRVVIESMKLPVHVWRGIIDGMLANESVGGLRGTRIPTLIVWGDRDTLFPRTEQHALEAMFAMSTLKVYGATGHALHWERPEWFARDLEAFVAEGASVSLSGG